MFRVQSGPSGGGWSAWGCMAVAALIAASCFRDGEPVVIGVDNLSVASVDETGTDSHGDQVEH